MPFFLERHLTALFILPVVLGIAFPEIGSLLSPAVAPLLFAVMTLSLLDVPVLQSLKSSLNLQSAQALVIQYGLFGLLGFLASRLFPPELFIGFVIVAATPSGISAPAIVELYGGNTDKSVSLTVLNNVFAPVWMPLFVFALAGQQLEFSIISLFQNLALFIFLPMIAAGVIKRTPARNFLHSVKRPLNLLILITLGWALVSKSADFFRQQPLTALSVGGVLLIAACAVFFAGAKLSKNRRDQIAYSTVCYHRNYTLSITLLTTLFTPVAAAVGVVYLVVVHVMVALSGLVFPVRFAASSRRSRG